MPASRKDIIHLTIVAVVALTSGMVFARLYSVFMPPDHQIEYITLLGNVAAQNWGAEVANQIVGELIANLE